MRIMNKKIEYIIVLKNTIISKDTYNSFPKILNKMVKSAIKKSYEKIVITIEVGNGDRDLILNILRFHSTNIIKKYCLKSKRRNVKIVLL